MESARDIPIIRETMPCLLAHSHASGIPNRCRTLEDYLEKHGYEDTITPRDELIQLVSAGNRAVSRPC